MESLNIKKLRIVESKKGNKIQKQKQLRKIGNLLRYAEICVLMVLVSRVSLQQLPLALKNSTEYLRGFTISPLFVFLVGNIIIITLFAQSGQFSPPSPTKRGSDSEPEPDLYLEFLQNSTTNTMMYQNIQIADRKRITIKDGCKIKQQQSEKESISIKVKAAEKKRTKVKRDCEVKEYRRCQSEVMLVKGVEESEEKPRVLQRCESESEKTKRTATSTNHEIEEENGMSNDEFRRTVEAFISRQQRLRLQELQTL